MSGSAITQPVGTALRIAPGFVATASDDTSGVETTIEAHYSPERGRYIITTIVNRAVSADFDEDRLRHTAPQAILQAAIPQCIAVQLDDGPDESWLTIADLPPVKMIALELNVPERTASDWIKKARGAGRLVGLTSNVGRPASD